MEIMKINEQEGIRAFAPLKLSCSAFTAAGAGGLCSGHSRGQGLPVTAWRPPAYNEV
uniref:hypothetical protein n=1 Tax=Lachnoclostridium phocaeense TaxID=1871021 RepID=UPI0026DC4E68|nr:hypothetical protein [Lachnoclostridium phocaeense]